MTGTPSASGRGRAQTIVMVALAAGLLLAVASVARPELSAAHAQPDASSSEPTPASTATTQIDDIATPLVVREAPGAGTLLRQYLDARYGPGGERAAWHANIRHVAMRFGTAVIQTNLTDGPEAGQKAAAISEAVLGFCATPWGRQLTDVAVEVYGQGGQLLAQNRVQQMTPSPVPTVDP